MFNSSLIFNNPPSQKKLRIKLLVDNLRMSTSNREFLNLLREKKKHFDISL